MIDAEDRAAQNAEPWNNTAGVDSSMLAYEEEEEAERDGVPMKQEARGVGTDGEEDKCNVAALEATSDARSTTEERNPSEDLALAYPAFFPRSNC